MKKNIISIASYFLIFVAFTGCSKDESFKEVDVTAVKTLYSPDDNKNVVLQTTGSASLYFEWEKAVAQDNGLVYYDVLFDKEDGDFSNPIYVVPAENKGTSTGANITHQVLNKIAGLAGIPTSQEGAIKWTIQSSRGLTKVLSAESRVIHITRLNSIEPPSVLYLTGEGTEGGADLTQALPVKALTGGSKFEIYTKLLAGKTYKFVDSKTTVSRTFSVDAGGPSFKENETGATVAKDGIYRISLDFIASSVSVEEITKLDFFMCTAQQRVTLNYQGKGIWQVNDIVPDFKTGFSDDRYYFLMTIGGSEQKVGSSVKNNQPPTTNTGSFFYLNFHPEDKDQWNYSFKFPNRNVQKCSFTVKFSSEIENYTHIVTY
ncbi:SusE outer membrane protein [bacterium A37T11]|nr:SusE outer membrane protein [bacterium A37T11]